MRVGTWVVLTLLSLLSAIMFNTAVISILIVNIIFPSPYHVSLLLTLLFLDIGLITLLSSICLWDYDNVDYTPRARHYSKKDVKKLQKQMEDLVKDKCTEEQLD